MLTQLGYLTVGDPSLKTLTIPNASIKEYVCEIMVTHNMSNQDMIRIVNDLQDAIWKPQEFIDWLQFKILDHISQERTHTDFQGLIAGIYDMSIISQQRKRIHLALSSSEAFVEGGRIDTLIYRPPSDNQNTVILHEYKVKPTNNTIEKELEDALWQIYQKDYLSYIFKDFRRELGNPSLSTIEVRAIVFYRAPMQQ